MLKAKKINYEFKTPSFIPPELAAVKTTAPFLNTHGYLVELTLMQGNGGYNILCLRQRIECEPRRTELLKASGLAAAHNAIYLNISLEEAEAFKFLPKTDDTAGKQAAQTFVEHILERIEYTETNDSLNPQIYAHAAYGLDDSLLSYNRLLPPYDTLVSVFKLQKFYEFTSGKAVKKYSRELKKKQGAKS